MASAAQPIRELLEQGLRALRAAKDAKAAEAVFREFAGRRGLIRAQLSEIGKLPPSQRARAGRAIHEALARFERAAEERIAMFERLEEERALAHERLDVTLPVKTVKLGTLHPLTRVRRAAERIFLGLGFSIAEGPEIEDAWHNFDALNIPEDHPSRDLWDTFWLKAGDVERPRANTERTPWASGSGGKLLLRTHTSPVQIRYMETHAPPFRIIAPGVTYRYEATDASHDMQFMQIEGLMVDFRHSNAPVTMSTLVSVLTAFFTRFFGKPVALRIRPSYFPFVEPGIEADLSCVVCNGEGKIREASRSGVPCSVCRESGWVEILGAGMVHPKVFDAVRYNPADVQGFAFGFGIDRLAMLKYRIPDIRLFRYGDTRFLKQFR